MADLKDTTIVGSLTLSGNLIATNKAAATQTQSGLMSADDKRKLDGIAVGATNNGSGSLGSYVQRAGDTMTGPLTLSGNRYADNNQDCALNLMNSNIIGINSLYMSDTSNDAGEGIHFPNDNGKWDTIRAVGGQLLFNAQRSLNNNAGSQSQVQTVKGAKNTVAVNTLASQYGNVIEDQSNLTFLGRQASSAQICSKNKPQWYLNGQGRNLAIESEVCSLGGFTFNSSTADIIWPDTGNWASGATVNFPVKLGGLHWSGQSDGVNLFAEETSSDNLNLVLHFTDDNSNGVIVRESTGHNVVTMGASGDVWAAGKVEATTGFILRNKVKTQYNETDDCFETVFL